jgi:GTP:adenosylcobinamide-phosphate guanylyltransferase
MADPMMKIPVLLLAGGMTPEELQSVTQEKERAFIPLLGRPMVSHIIENINKNMFIIGITIVGNVERLKKEFEGKDFDYIEDAGSLLDNVMNGLRTLETHRRVLIMTADIPLITADIIASTLLECQKDDAEVYYPIVIKSIIEKKFPGGKRTYVSMREGQFTGGNIFLVNPKAILRSENIFRKAIAFRKKPLKLAGIFGLSFILRMIFGMLDIPMLEKKASKILGVSVRAIISPSAELAMDVDKEKDYLMVTRFLERKRELESS